MHPISQWEAKKNLQKQPAEKEPILGICCVRRQQNHLMTITCKAGNDLPPFPPSSSLEEKKLWLEKWGGRGGTVRNRVRIILASLTLSPSLVAEPNSERGQEITINQVLSFDYFIRLLVPHQHLPTPPTPPHPFF